MYTGSESATITFWNEDGSRDLVRCWATTAEAAYKDAYAELVKLGYNHDSIISAARDI
jgi:hypothetical protein